MRWRRRRWRGSRGTGLCSGFGTLRAGGVTVIFRLVRRFVSRPRLCRRTKAPEQPEQPEKRERRDETSRRRAGREVAEVDDVVAGGKRDGEKSIVGEQHVSIAAVVHVDFPARIERLHHAE